MLSVYEDRGGGQRSDAAALPARLCRRALHLWLADDGGLWRRERLEAELSEDSLVALDVFKPLDLVGGEGRRHVQNCLKGTWYGYLLWLRARSNRRERSENPKTN